MDLPSTSPDTIATIVAATQEAAPTWTPSPVVSPTPTPPPTLTSTPVPGTPASPIRIPMLRGATSAVLQGRIGAGETQAYVVRGAQLQPMLVHLASEGNQATLFIMSQGGMYFLRPGKASSWQGSLPQSGSYFLGIYGGSAATDYTLSVQLVTRIRFKEGKTSTALAGNTPDGAVATFSLFGVKGKKLTLTLSGAGSRAALNVVGFIDGTTYLAAAANERNLKLVLPATQDYIIEIVPSPGETIDYILEIQLE